MFQIGVEFIGKDGEVYIVSETLSRKAVILLKWDNDSGSYKIAATHASKTDLEKFLQNS